MNIPNVWNEAFSDYIEKNLMNEAAKRFRIHQLPARLEDWQKHRKKLLAELWQHLSVPYDGNLELNLQETGSTQMDGYSVKNIFFQSRPGIYVTGNLYVPDGEGPFPGVIGTHGHYLQGRLAEAVQARGHTLAKSGYVCLQVDAWGAGERSTIHGEYEYHGAGLGGALLNIGESLIGAQVVDNMRAVDVLCSLDYVDSSKLGATGASGGGNQTMWLAAMDERITAAVPVVSVGTFQAYVMGVNCVCECLPNGLNFTEESGILGLIAPRALKICNCLYDSNPSFYPSEMLRSYKESRKIFKAYGEDSKISYQLFAKPHGYDPEIRCAMLGWFDLHLKGKGNGAPRDEPEFESLDEELLMVFEKGERPNEVVSIYDYCRTKGKVLKDKALQTNFDAKNKREELAELLKVTEPLELKNFYQYDNASGWERFSLETKCGRLIPVLLRRPLKSESKFVIASSIKGKADLVKSNYLKEILNSNCGILLFDVYGSGETSSEASAPNRRNAFHTSSRALLWLGKTLYGEWCQEFMLLAEWCRKCFEADNIAFFGYKELGAVAVLAGALDENISEVKGEESPNSFVFDKRGFAEQYSMGFCLPNIINWGDLELAIKLNNGEVAL